MHAVYAVGIPWLGHLQRTQEHLVETKGVGTELSHDIIGINHIEHRLRHLLYRPAALIHAVFQHKLSVLVLRHPRAESLKVEHIVAHDIHIHMDRLHAPLVFRCVDKPIRDIGVRTANQAIDEVRTPLNHTLVDEFLKGLVLADITEVVEELVPEAAVDKVSRGVLAAAEVEVHLPPVLVHCGRYQCLAVVVVHIA